MHEQLTQLLSALPADAPRRLAEAVLAHRRVFVCGAGRSRLMLQAFAMRLAQAGLAVHVAGETTAPAIAAGDLLVTASASGSTAGVLHCATVAQQYGADLFVITAQAQSPLAALHPADVLLPAPTKESAAAGPYPMGTLFEQALLLYLDDAVAALPPEKQPRRELHANLE